MDVHVHSCMLLTASTDNPTEVDHMIALKCLASFLVPKRKKQYKNDHYTVVPFFLIDVPVSFAYYNMPEEG